jgi:hypothetical protein
MIKTAYQTLDTALQFSLLVTALQLLLLVTAVRGQLLAVHAVGFAGLVCQLCLGRRVPFDWCCVGVGK